jgi:hypothetical protein
MDMKLVSRTIDAHQRYQMTYWDSLIIATAELANCSTLISEDFNTAQKYFKESLINLDEFWQRQISRIKAYELLMLIALEVSITQSLGIWLSPTG